MTETSIFDFSALTIRGREQPLSTYAGQVLLVVNTASRCGFTPQYEGLQQLEKKYADSGFHVLGFPCDQFAGQEPGSADDIETFCSGTFGVTFPMFAKVDVNGRNAHPVFAWLRSQKRGVLGNRIKWNFTKFLVGRDGQVIRRYSSTTKPEEIAGDIEAALAATAP